MDPQRLFDPLHPSYIPAIARNNNRDPFGRTSPCPNPSLNPISHSSLSSGQSFYTVESLEGATSLPLLPNHSISPADRESLPQNRALGGFAGRSGFPETRMVSLQNRRKLDANVRIREPQNLDSVSDRRMLPMGNLRNLETIARFQNPQNLPNVPNLDLINPHYWEPEEGRVNHMSNLQNVNSLSMIQNRRNLGRANPLRSGPTYHRVDSMENLQNLDTKLRLENRQNRELENLHRLGVNGGGMARRCLNLPPRDLCGIGKKSGISSSSLLLELDGERKNGLHRSHHVLSSGYDSLLPRMGLTFGSHLQRPLFDQGGICKKAVVGPQSRNLKFQKQEVLLKPISATHFVGKEHIETLIRPQKSAKDVSTKERVKAMPHNKRPNNEKSKGQEEAERSVKRAKVSSMLPQGLNVVKAIVKEGFPRCEICNVSCTSQHNLNAHLLGKRHAAHVKELAEGRKTEGK